MPGGREEKFPATVNTEFNATQPVVGRGEITGNRKEQMPHAREEDNGSLNSNAALSIPHSASESFKPSEAEEDWIRREKRSDDIR